ncbi:MAG: YkgJ family cysteine cluster protein [Polyangiaceae bacterium]|nr:YkgJ family cysteine cluster protein [Polyangiaceae bacterium]
MSERFHIAGGADQVVQSVLETATALIAESRAQADGPGLAALPTTLMAEVRARSMTLQEQALASGRRPACREGCAWCCYGTRVELVAPEALVIAASLTAPDQEALRTRIRETARRVQSMSAADRHRERIACPLLDQERGSCRVYAVRPLACRGLGSMNSEACADALAHSDEDRPIPKHLPLLVSQSAVATGMRLALGRAGLDERLLEASAAIDIALSHRHAAQRWAGGEKLFGPAATTTRAGPVGAAARFGPMPSPVITRNQRKALRRAQRGR